MTGITVNNYWLSLDWKNSKQSNSSGINWLVRMMLLFF